MPLGKEYEVGSKLWVTVQRANTFYYIPEIDIVSNVVYDNFLTFETRSFVRNTLVNDRV